MPLTRIKSLGITDGAIVAADIANGAITSAKLASGVGGKILQVVQVTKTDILSTTSTSFIDATGLSASITPSSASNKILMTVSVPFGASTRAFFKLVRGSTDILLGDSAGSRIPANFHGYGDATVGDAFYALQMFSFSVLDTPSTTSSTTYKIQWRANTGGTIYINRDGDDTNNTEHSRSASTIILMEIAA